MKKYLALFFLLLVIVLMTGNAFAQETATAPTTTAQNANTTDSVPVTQPAKQSKADKKAARAAKKAKEAKKAARRKKKTAPETTPAPTA